MKVLPELDRRRRSFGYAWAGCRYVWRTQPNAWIHAVVSAVVVALAAWLRIGAWEWAVLLLTITVVWAAEFFNTAVEAIVDMVMPEHHPLAAVAKDVAAGAVLVVAIGATLVGALLLGPPLLARLGVLGAGG